MQTPRSVTMRGVGFAVRRDEEPIKACVANLDHPIGTLLHESHCTHGLDLLLRTDALRSVKLTLLLRVERRKPHGKLLNPVRMPSHLQRYVCTDRAPKRRIITATN